MNNNDKPQLTPEQLQMLEANRRLQEFTDKIMQECFGFPKPLDALPNKEDEAK